MIWIFQNLFWNHMEGFKYTQHNQTNNLNIGKHDFIILSLFWVLETEPILPPKPIFLYLVHFSAIMWGYRSCA